MSSRITYENKKALQNDENVARENKVTDLDMNEIKEVVNSHADDIEKFNNYDDTAIKTDIHNIEIEQETQNTNIAKLQEDVSEINEKNNAQDEEIEALKQENIELKRTQDDMIEKQLNKETEADTSVITKDTDEFCGKLSIFGGQRQEKRAGINLIDVGKLKAVTKNGINFTPNEDGSININGTATNDTSYFLRDGTLALGIYTYKCFGLPDNLYANCWYCGNAYGEAVKKITSNVENRNYVIELKIPAETTLNVTIEPMLIAGEYTAETFPEYEPYGVMPSLEFPSKIEAVGDKTYAIESGSIEGQAGANIVNQQRLRTKDFIRNTYKQILVNANGIDEVALFEYDKDKNYIKSNSWRVVPATFDLSDNTAFFKYAFRKSDNSNLSTDMITNLEDSNKCVEITTSNKNVLDIQKNAHLEVSGLAIDTDENGEVTINGTATANTYLKLYDNELTNLNYTKWDKKKVAKGNWVFSSRMIKGEINAEANTSAYVRSKAMGADAVEYAMLYRVLNAKEKQKSFTLEDDTKAVIYLWIGKDATFNNVKLQFQLEPDVLSEYVEHRGQTLTLQTQQKMFEGDTFEQVDGVWYEKHDKGEYVLDGVNNKFTYRVTNGSLKIKIEDAIASGGYWVSHNNLFLMCTHFTQAEKQAAFKAGEVIYWDTQGDLYVKPELDRFTTVDEANEWLKEQYEAGTPVTIAYQRTEPLYIKCTPEQSKILDKIDTYRDGTIITTDNDLCKISLRYKQNLESRIEQIEKQLATEVAEEE